MLMQQLSALEAANAGLRSQVADKAMRLQTLQDDYHALQVGGVCCGPGPYVCAWLRGCEYAQRLLIAAP